MSNKIKHYNATQALPNMEFKPLKRGESPYYGNLNRPAKSSYDLANAVSNLVSWGGSVSILDPVNTTDTFVLYQLVKITDDELITPITGSDNLTTIRVGLIVAEPEFDTETNSPKNACVLTFCPNFLYPTEYASHITANVGDLLYVNYSGNIPMLSTVALGKPVAKKTGPNSIFFSGMTSIW